MLIVMLDAVLLNFSFESTYVCRKGEVPRRWMYQYFAAIIQTAL